jgi:GH15 family glucan-1,4-alpha-glucosidase
LRVDGYAPIRDYAAIGDGRTTALVARDGSIDWLCFPERDSPTVFGALLDPARGGRFVLVPRERFEVARRYLPETNVLETTYTTAEGTARVTDLMTLQDGGLPPWTELVRKVEGLSGRVSFSWSVEPRFGHGLEETSLEVCDGIPLATSGAETLAVSSWDAGDPSVENSAVGGAFAVREGGTAVIALSGVHDRPVHLQPRDAVERRIKGTVSTWKRWLQARDGAYEGPWKDDVLRSVLALKLLIHTTGAITAAATSSLPERIGGDKNYDYRYGWVRDSAFTLDALLHLGYHEQAHASFRFLFDALESTRPRVQPIYTIRGEPLERERQLDVPGYRDSRPVRVGNDAADQLQLGGYGALLATTWRYVRDGNVLDEPTRVQLAEAVDLLGTIWTTEDSGVWELPTERRYTQSRMAAWETFDRALDLVANGQLPAAHAGAWRRTAEAIEGWIEANCWSETQRSYTMYPGTEALDASCLLAARMQYGDPAGERSIATIEALRRELGRGSLLYRYSGMPEEEGAFVPCSFWLVESLARAGRVDEAAELMDEMVALANDVGLFAEQIEPETGDFLGNVPQGLSHLALVNAALVLEEGPSAGG